MATEASSDEGPQDTAIHTALHSLLESSNGASGPNGNQLWKRRVAALRGLQAALRERADADEKATRADNRTAASDMVALGRLLNDGMRCLRDGIDDARAVVCKEACAAVAEAARAAGPAAAPLVAGLLPAMLGNLSNPKPGFAKASDSALRVAFSRCPCAAFLEPVLEMAGGAGTVAEARKCALLFLAVIVGSWPASAVLGQRRRIAAAICAGSKCRSSDTRVGARRAVWAYRERWPDLGEELMKTLDNTQRKMVAEMEPPPPLPEVAAMAAAIAAAAARDAEAALAATLRPPSPGPRSLSAALDATGVPVPAFDATGGSERGAGLEAQLAATAAAAVPMAAAAAPPRGQMPLVEAAMRMTQGFNASEKERRDLMADCRLMASENEALETQLAEGRAREAALLRERKHIHGHIVAAQSAACDSTHGPLVTDALKGLLRDVEKIRLHLVGSSAAELGPPPRAAILPGEAALLGAAEDAMLVDNMNIRRLHQLKRSPSKAERAMQAQFNATQLGSAGKDKDGGLGGGTGDELYRSAMGMAPAGVGRKAAAKAGAEARPAAAALPKMR